MQACAGTRSQQWPPRCDRLRRSWWPGNCGMSGSDCWQRSRCRTQTRPRKAMERAHPPAGQTGHRQPRVFMTMNWLWGCCTVFGDQVMWRTCVLCAPSSARMRKPGAALCLQVGTSCSGPLCVSAAAGPPVHSAPAKMVHISKVVGRLDGRVRKGPRACGVVLLTPEQILHLEAGTQGLP